MYDTNSLDLKRLNLYVFKDCFNSFRYLPTAFKHVYDFIFKCSHQLSQNNFEISCRRGSLESELVQVTLQLKLLKDQSGEFAMIQVNEKLYSLPKAKVHLTYMKKLENRFAHRVNSNFP